MGNSASQELMEEVERAPNEGQEQGTEHLFVDDGPTLAALPLIGENRIMIGRHLVTEEELRRMEGPDQLNPVNQISIAESALRILSGGSSVIIEEYNVGTAITLIATLADSHRLLIVADGKDIGAIYEYFNDTRTEVGIIAKETQMRSCRCNIVAPELVDQMDISPYPVCLLVIRSSWGVQALQSVLAKVRGGQKMLLVAYRMYPDHGYGNDLLVNETGETMSVLMAKKPHDSTSMPDLEKMSDIRGKEFLSLDDLLRTIKVIAAKEGFDIVRKDSVKETRRVRFVCSRARRRGIPADQACPFRLYVKFERSQKVYRVKELNNEHNHLLTPGLTKWRLLNTKQIRIVLSFRRNRMPLIEINRNIKELFGIDIELTGQQLRRLKRNGLANVDELESNELARSIQALGGIVRIKEEPDDEGKLRRSAILAIDESEVQNLQGTFGNPLFIDGTAVPNRLKWELTMITLVDQYLGIQPAGAMFSLYTNSETYDWFIEQLMDIIGSREKLTIITDEDLAMSATIDAFNARQHGCKICHVIRAWHKERNFEKKIGKCGFSDDEKTAIRSLWKRICYSPKQSVVDTCVQKLRDYRNARLGHYIDKHVVPLLPKFARAFIPEFTAGYNVSSLSESANALLKRNMTAAYYTLREIKDCVRMVFRQKNVNAHEKLLLSRRGGLFLEREFGISVAPKVEELLVASLVKSFRLENIGDNVYRDRRYPDEFFRVDYPECECRKLKYSGLPCSHIMKWSLENKKNPMLLVSERYLAHEPSFTEFSDYVDETGDLWREIIYSDYRGTRKRIAEAFEQLEERFPDRIPTGTAISTASIPTPGRSHVVRYNEILSYAKDLARSASVTEEETEKAIRCLKELLDSFASSCSEEAEKDVYEAIGKRRGRPAKSRLKSAFERARARKCKICDLLNKENDHLTGLCKYYGRVRELGKTIDSQVTEEHGKRCRICGAKGHNAKKCRAVLKLVQELEDGESQ